MRRGENWGDRSTIYTKIEGTPMTSGFFIAQMRKRTYHNRQSLLVAGTGKKKEKQLAHGEGRTRSLQIARAC